MKRKLVFYGFAYLLITVFFVSCHTGEQTVSKAPTRKPKFIEGIYLGAHSKVNVLNNGIDNNYGYSTVKNLSFNKTENQPNDGGEGYNKNADFDLSVVNTLSIKYAEMLGVLARQISNYSLYQFIDEWYGVHYRIGGSSKTGIDCSAFTQKLYNQVFGVDLFRTAAEQLNSCTILKNVNDLTEGDLVFFHIHGRRISHVGIYLVNDYFVHASRSQGITISNLKDDYWRKYYACAGRLNKD